MWVWMAAAFGACPDLEESIAEAEAAVQELRLDDARSELDEVEAALECAWADPGLLARFFVADGAWAVYSGEPADTVNASFSAARRVDDSQFDANYGKKLRARWDAADDESGIATWTLAALPDDAEVRLDGVIAVPPLSVRAGLHVVQVGRGSPSQAWVTVAAAGLPRSFEVELPEPIAPPVEPNGPAEPPKTPRRRRGTKGKALLVGSLATAAVGVGLMGLAYDQQARGIPRAENKEALDRARARQVAFGYSGYALVGLGAAGVTIHIVR